MTTSSDLSRTLALLHGAQLPVVERWILPICPAIDSELVCFCHVIARLPHAKTAIRSAVAMRVNLDTLSLDPEWAKSWQRYREWIASVDESAAYQHATMTAAQHAEWLQGAS